MMQGYKPDFLGHELDVPLPEFTPQVVEDVLHRPEVLREGRFADYLHYTIAMHRDFRTPLFSALNINWHDKRVVEGNTRWSPDSRVGAANQLTGEYYGHNVWDKGHMAMRANAAWGPSDSREALNASEGTYYYTNAALQHENFNRDEWVELEKWIGSLDDAENGLICEFTGPVFGDFMRTVRPSGVPVAYVPPSFFKVIAYVDKTLKAAQPAADPVDWLAVRAFLVHQDEAALADRRGRRKFNNQVYQVAIAEVERLTGLKFHDRIASRNPIFFSNSEAAEAVGHTAEGPEYRDINGAQDIITSGQDKRPNTYRDDEVGVYIAGAMVDPSGNEREREWVSLLNLSGEAVSIDGWTLLDRSRRSHTLSGEIQPGEARCIKPMGDIRLVNNPGDAAPGLIILNDENGDQIDRVSYRKKDLPGENKPVVFAYTYTD